MRGEGAVKISRSIDTPPIVVVRQLVTWLCFDDEKKPFDVPIGVNGKVVNWIDSKASFCDDEAYIGKDEEQFKVKGLFNAIFCKGRTVVVDEPAPALQEMNVIGPMILE
eukprot:gene16092-19087_t